MIELKHITKEFRHKGKVTTALSDVSLSVPAGAVMGVIGESGAGKSTLIRCVNLLERPTAGDVIVDGENLMLLPPAGLLKVRRNIGMIFQHFNLLTSLTVSGNIAFPLTLAHTSPAAARERVSELLQLVGLSDKADDYPAKLSGGQKQRVAIARALANNPKVLLCDEATSALDPATTMNILSLLKEINTRLNITILLITHEMKVVKTICDDVVVLSGGRLTERGFNNSWFYDI
jgi:D-methionine transport system ATP-binding protein